MTMPERIWAWRDGYNDLCIDTIDPATLPNDGCDKCKEASGTEYIRLAPLAEEAEGLLDDHRKGRYFIPTKVAAFLSRIAGKV